MLASAFQQLKAWVNELATTAEGETDSRNTLLTGIANHVFEYLNGATTVQYGAGDAVLVDGPTGNFDTDCRQLKTWVDGICSDQAQEENYLVAIEHLAEEMCDLYGSVQKRSEISTTGTKNTGQTKDKRSWKSRWSSLKQSRVGSSGYEQI